MGKGGGNMAAMPVKVMSNTFIEHSLVINNFVTAVGIQLKSSLCRVFGDSEFDGVFDSVD